MKRIFLFSYLALLTVLAFTDEMVISVKLSTQEITKETQIVPIEVEFLIPQDMYQSYNRDFFYFTVEGIEGMTQDEIKYPEGELKDDTTLYFGRTILSGNIQLPADLPRGPFILQINVAYQLCDINGMCYFPEEEEILMEIELCSEM